MRRILAGVSCAAMAMTVGPVMRGVSTMAKDMEETTVYDLRTEDLINPVGLDSATPVFSWKMRSDVIGQKQTAYQIVVTVNDTTVWDSTRVESDVSVGIRYEGQPLQSSTAYKWTLTVWDKDGHPVPSRTAAFETGLLEEDAWDDAQWISPGTHFSSETTYTIDFDFIIDKFDQGFCFGMRDGENLFMWQINASDPQKVLLRPHIRSQGQWTSQDFDITSQIGYTSQTILGVRLHERLEVDGPVVKTYLGPDADHLTLVNTYTHTADIPLNKIGFRHQSEEARYDNIVIKAVDGAVLYQNDFESGDLGFSGAGDISLQEGMLKVGKDGSAEQVFIQNDEENDNTCLPVYRKSVTLKDGLVSAKLYTSGLGIYESYINGQRVGRLQEDGTISYDELKPGFTEMGARKFYNSYDVTWMLDKGGENVLSAVVTSGWWSGKIVSGYGKETAYLAKLILTYADGSREVMNTDTSWKTAKASAVQMADVFAGETYDARVDQSWMLPGFDDGGWAEAAVNTEFTGTISAWMGSPIVVREDLERSAKSIAVYKGATGAMDGQYGKIQVLRTYEDGEEIALEPGETLLVDFGQNFAGWEAFEVEGPSGTTLTIEHGEMLNDGNGAVSRGCDGPEGSIYNANYRTAECVTRYILNGEGKESWHPAFTYYGFRYIEITADQPVVFHSIDGQVVTSVEKETGFLETSDPDVNQLISNIRWGQYSNYLSVPTDCPQRDERLGWTGDTQNFAEAGCYMAFSKSFLEKFLQDMRDCQREDGAYTSTAPSTMYISYGVFGWADAGIILPYYLYSMYGDSTVITDNWDAMQKYMDVYMKETCRAGVDPADAGDWLAYESNDEAVKWMLSVCYYAWDALMMSEMAQAIGRPDDAAKYRQVYEEEKAYFQSQFVNTDGTLKREEQSVCLYALFVDMLPDEASAKAVENQLISNIERNGNKLQTGFLGTEVILHTLTKIGRSDVAYKVLLQHGNPSWLFSVDQGATTIWERWNSYTLADGFGDVGMNSFNHYSYGSVESWMFRGMAGIGYDVEKPGFQHILLNPQPDQMLKMVNATYDSAYGPIVSHWTFEGSTWTYDADIPANTTAAIRIPVEKADTLRVNGKAPESLSLEDDGIVLTGEEEGILLFDAVAGSFRFTAEVTPYSYITLENGNADSGMPTPQVCIDGGAEQSLPVTLKVSPGQILSVTASLLNDVDYAVTNWTSEDGRSLSETAELQYMVDGDDTVMVQVEWVGYENLAKGAEVSANNIHEVAPSWQPSNLTDGILTSTANSLGYTTAHSYSDKVDYWIEVDLGADMVFDRIQLYPRTDVFAEDGTTAGFPRDFTIEVKKDSESTYTTIWQVTDFEKPYQRPAVLEFDTVEARYVRLHVSRLNDAPVGEPYYLQLAEMGVYYTGEDEPAEPTTDPTGDSTTDPDEDTATSGSTGMSTSPDEPTSPSSEPAGGAATGVGIPLVSLFLGMGACLTLLAAVFWKRRRKV